MFDYTFTLNKNQLAYISNFIKFQIDIIESSDDLNDLFYNKIRLFFLLAPALNSESL
jgi:hypothetical protein